MVTQLEALEQTIEALGERLQPAHGALVAAALGLAQAVDDETRSAPAQNRAVSAALWQRYQQAIETLAAIGAAENDDAGQSALLQLVKPVMQVEPKPDHHAKRRKTAE